MRVQSGILAAVAALGLSSARAAEDPFPPLFPFVISYDGPDNASSMAHLLDAPAGRHGFVRCANGRFVNDAGPVRLNATNLTGPANFPTHEQSERLAARLARFGLNCVRLHYMDAPYENFCHPPQPSLIAEDPATQRNLDPGRLERLDYMVAAFKKRGIYVDVNLHVARGWDERDGFPGKARRPGMDKGLDNFEPRMIELQKEYARKLLTHVNPYTGLAYAADPCVAVVELNNENALLQVYHGGGIDALPEPYAGELRRQWNAWLRGKYATTSKLLAAWKWTPVPLSNEQVPEGRFDAPLSIDGRRWMLARGGGEAVCTAGGGVLRVEVGREGRELFPKLFRTLTVKKDQVYTLSFRARRTRGSGESKLGLAIADTTQGWRSLGVHQVIDVGPAWKTFSYAFQAADDSQTAQFQLTRFKAGTYEIQNLSFQSGAQSDFDLTQRLEDDGIPPVKLGRYAPPPAVRDFYQFLVDTERNYWVGMADYLRRELKVQALISGTQLGYSPPFVQADLDYIDNHAYWQHPSPVSPQWRVGNDAMVRSLACIQALAGQRVLGKPYTISEYNHPFPNQYGAEGQPLLRAYGRLQGWDGVFEYTYNHRPDFEPRQTTYFFSMLARSDVLAHLPACAAIFLRGDVQEARGTVVAGLDYASYFDRLTKTKAVAADIGGWGGDPRACLIHKTAVDLAGQPATAPPAPGKRPPAQQVFASDTGELTWNLKQPDAAYWTVNTPNTRLFTGFPRGRTIELGDVNLAIGRTRLEWATVSLVSRNATGFGADGRPASILVAATGLAENTGQRIEPTARGTITLGDWGQGPVLVEGIPATLTLPVAASRVRCFALDPSGDRGREIVVAPAGRGARLELKPEYRTIWYELAVGRP